MGHNVIIGKSYGGHFEFMQIRPPMKCFFLSPSKKYNKVYCKESLCQISWVYTKMVTVDYKLTKLALSHYLHYERQ